MCAHFSPENSSLIGKIWHVLLASHIFGHLLVSLEKGMLLSLCAELHCFTPLNPTPVMTNCHIFLNQIIKFRYLIKTNKNAINLCNLVFLSLMSFKYSVKLLLLANVKIQTS